jgi:plastocyanin
MKRILLSILLLLSFTFGYSTIVTVTNVGFTFSPATLNITVGDSVNFNIATIHTVQEVNLTTWNANGVTPLAGGFSLPLGGGMVPAAFLTVGTHYYVCTVHVGTTGMKGQIIVSPATGIRINQMENTISLNPNPVTTFMKMNLNIPDFQKAQLNILNIAGQEIMNQPVKNGENIIDMEKLQDGIYYVMVIADNKQIFNSKITVIK